MKLQLVIRTHVSLEGMLGPSRNEFDSGKTTLVARTLLGCNVDATFVDEFLVIESARTHPTPDPLTLARSARDYPVGWCLGHPSFAART